MILTESKIKALCDANGITRDAFDGCIVEVIGGGMYRVDPACSAFPKPTADAPPAGLGDMIAAALAAFGVTKERVEAVVGGPCGCPERQAALNAAGAKWLGMPAGSTAPPDCDQQAR